ncbi:MAG: AAC(3) family N-acetyltransferase [Lentisphaeria bacterium]|nr:AAC(3) family N-acetyltransferase [Lentisphaeria bacterium]
MFTKQDLINDIIRMGLKPDDTVFVHSSYKSIAGETGIEGGADTVVDAFMEYFGEKGLVVFPAMSWKLGWLINEEGQMRDPVLGPAPGFREYGSLFDVRNTPCHGLGCIPETFRKRPGVIRSLCPTSSVAAFGKDAAEFCAGHENAPTALHWHSPWGKLYSRNAKTLFLGTTMICNTFMHVIEEYSGVVPGLLRDYIWKYEAIGYDGRKIPVSFKRHEPHHNQFYRKVEPELMEKGIVELHQFGAAEVHLADIRKETDYMMIRLKSEPTLFCLEK